ncbi:MAG TPA: putative cytokinetic ring protein SteA [Actinomycetota bacterium]|nr:putative cytokinetic ring protein SteA [Actinomycetota bacterium]
MRRKMRRRPDTIAGVARTDRRTKELIQRIRPGEIAVIDHEDLDRVSAEGLVEAGVALVVNARSSITGRYPNTGPLVLARAGIPIVDGCGPALFEVVHEGDEIRTEEGRIYRGPAAVIEGVLLDEDEIVRRIAHAEASVGEELERFVVNTMDYLQTEGDMILRGEGIPFVRTDFRGRHALIVVRGHDFKQDLRTLRGYISDLKPVLVAVDGAADALLDEGWKPDMIIGDMDSVSERALRSGADLVVHGYPDGRAPGLERLASLGLGGTVFATGGTSEDIAMLLAYERGADLIVAVGTHANLVEFLDKGRAGMASTFLVRLKVGPKLVDAKGVNRLYRNEISRGLLILLVASAFLAMVVAFSAAPGLRLFIENLGERFQDLWFRIRHLF